LYVLKLTVDCQLYGSPEIPEYSDGSYLSRLGFATISDEQNLKKAIQQQISAAFKCAQIDSSAIQEKLDSYTWTGIFIKVRETYMSCL